MFACPRSPAKVVSPWFAPRGGTPQEMTRARGPSSEGHDERWYFQDVAIRVVLAEDNALLREGMTRMIGAEDDVELVGVACDYPELIELIDRHEPDVVITDIRMPPTGTDEGIR